MEPFFADYLRILEEKRHQFQEALAGLPPEAINWQPVEGGNSLGALAVHAAGATRYWVGDAALNDPLRRDRPGEFAATGLTAEPCCLLRF